MREHAKLTSKGRVTVPLEVRRALGVKAGDRLLFESAAQGIYVRAVRMKSAFSKYRGIGNSEVGSGRKNIARWLRELRGQ